MQGSYVNIWVPKEPPTISETEECQDSGFHDKNVHFNKGFDKGNEKLSNDNMKFSTIEERIMDCCRQFKISLISRSEKYDLDQDRPLAFGEKPSGPSVFLQLFVTDDILENFCISLQKCGVGVVRGTVISVIPTSVSIFNSNDNEELDEVPNLPIRKKKLSNQKSQSQASKHKIEKFYKSIKSRLIVAEVIKRIEAGAEFSFDFVMYLLSAAAIAFLGLVENSTVSLVASMLVSPLMGPILAIVFGLAIKNKKLISVGLKRELYAITICICAGFILGSIFVVRLNRSNNVLAVTSPDWPTSEMQSRTGWSTLVVGICVAVPSGVGVALAVLGGNQAGGVGVAISASLLPPAVNTGLHFAMAMFSYHYDANSMIDADSVYKNGAFNNTDTAFTFEYARGNIPLELFLRGLVSLCLTGVNILCILLFGVLTLLIKQVTPNVIPQRNATFWKKDVQLNKEYEKTIVENNLENLKAEGAELGLSDRIVEELFENAANDANVIESRKWVEAAYPRDDLEKYPGYQEDSVVSSCPEPEKFCYPNIGRFQVITVRRDIDDLVEEEIKHAERRLSQGPQELAAGGLLQRGHRGSLFNLPRNNLFNTEDKRRRQSMHP